MSDHKHSVKYMDYIQSEAWHKKRKRKLKEANFHCEQCGADGALQVHHKTYDRLGREWMKDLEVLCPSCHEKADKRRQWMTNAKKVIGRLTGIYSKKKRKR